MEELNIKEEVIPMNNSISSLNTNYLSPFVCFDGDGYLHVMGWFRDGCSNRSNLHSTTGSTGTLTCTWDPGTSSNWHIYHLTFKNPDNVTQWDVIFNSNSSNGVGIEEPKRKTTVIAPSL